MSEQRERLPDKEQMALIADVDALIEWLDHTENQAIVIETQLEMRSDDGATEDWERRAQSALVAHRICAKNLRAEIHRRRMGVRKTTAAASEGASQTKAENKATNELAAANALERKRQGLEQAKLVAVRSAKKMIERLAYDRLWQQCAHELLTAEQCREIGDRASLRHREAMVAAIDEAAA